MRPLSSASVCGQHGLFAALAGFFALAGALRADLPLASESPAIFDDFSSQTTFDQNWNARTGANAVGYNTAAALSLGTDGSLSVLKIAGQSQPTNGYPFTCGGVLSKLGLGYGYYEISAKLPPETGWHCSFWLAGGGNEIDAPEIDTGPSSATAPRSAVFNTHYWPPATSSSKVSHIGWGLDYTSSGDSSRNETASVDTASGYHRYGFEWTPTRIFFYLDNVLVAQTRYPGPHFATNTVQISLLAYNASGVGVQTPTTMFVDYFKFYRRNYGFADWNTAGLNVALPAGDSTFSASLNAVDPDQAPYTSGTAHVIASNDFSGTAHWDFPASTTAPSGRYEVFAWNPSTFSPSSLSADISAAPQDANHNPGGMSVGYTVGGGLIAADPVYGGQSWLGLGAQAFSGATASAITLAVPSGSAPNPLWTLRAGPAVFRPLTRYDDFSSGTLGSAWSIVSGSWSASAGYAANSGTGECVLLRQSSDVTIGDGLVRTQLAVPATGGATSAGLLARYTATGCYLLRINYVSGELGILKKVSGSYVSLADVTIPSDISLSAALDVVFVLKNSGTADVDLLGFIAGRPIAAVTDYAPGSAYTGGGQAGVRAYGGVAQFDNFGVGN